MLYGVGMQHVAFLRGINVGAAGKGRKSLPMAALCELAESLGWGRVQTYIQSGNLVFDAPIAAARAEQMLADAISRRFGFDVQVIVRPIKDLARAAGNCPFADVVDERPNLVHIGFAKNTIGESSAAAFAAHCKGDERVVVQDQFIWIDYASGVARSKLTPAVLDRVLGSAVTLRNVKTLRAIALMAH